jgi:hypothetical protein
LEERKKLRRSIAKIKEICENRNIRFRFQLKYYLDTLKKKKGNEEMGRENPEKDLNRTGKK